MSKIGINLKINVSNIEKERLFVGEKGKYLNATCFIDLDEADQYGYHGMITQNVSKEEREAGARGPILGNVSIFWRDSDSAPQPARPEAPSQSGDDFDDDLPF